MHLREIYFISGAYNTCRAERLDVLPQQAGAAWGAACVPFLPWVGPLAAPWPLAGAAWGAVWGAGCAARRAVPLECAVFRRRHGRSLRVEGARSGLSEGQWAQSLAPHFAIRSSAGDRPALRSCLSADRRDAVASSSGPRHLVADSGDGLHHRKVANCSGPRHLVAALEDGLHHRKPRHLVGVDPRLPHLLLRMRAYSPANRAPRPGLPHVRWGPRHPCRR